MLFGSRHKLKRTKCDKLQINDAKLEFVSQLPVNIRNIDSFDSFKAHQKKAMKENG